MALEALAQQWNDYRRALRSADREAFDALVNRARMHASAATYAISLDPAESALLSMLLEHEKELLEIRRKMRAGESEDEGSGEGGG
ncbi:MAG: hypothetical protein JW880_00860 [Candidatus Thermoplasmatota archaeon]|nr:hypothetical protein [Candidatus Thermoplasmatota archaeon]